MTQRTDAAGTTNCSYDNANRLKTVQDPASGTTLTYNYNQMPLSTSVSYGTNANTRTFGYDSLHRVTSDTLKTSAGTTIASISYGYDLNDNVTSKNTTGVTGASNNTYTYSARGTLKTSTENGVTVNYTSDAYGQQITEATLTGGTQTYLNDALGRNITASGPAGNLTFAYSGTDHTLASDGSSTYTWNPFDGLVGIGTPNGSNGSTGNGVLAFTDQHDDVVANFKTTIDLSPIPNSITANAFAYASPLSMTDPDGHTAVGKGGVTKVSNNRNDAKLKRLAAEAKKAKAIEKAKTKLKSRSKTKTKKISDARKPAKKVSKAKNGSNVGKSAARGSSKKTRTGKGARGGNQGPVIEQVAGPWPWPGGPLGFFGFGNDTPTKNFGEALTDALVEALVGDALRCVTEGSSSACALAVLGLVPGERLVSIGLKLGIKGIGEAGKLQKLLKIVDSAKRSDDPAKGTTDARRLLKEKEGTRGSRNNGPTCRTNSFAGSTLVLMADGSTKRIDEIKPGDEVKSSVPGSEDTEPHVVEAVIVTQKDRDLVNLKIATPEKGRAPPSTGELTTTAHHPFYDITQASFVDAARLNPGDHLQQPDGTTATVLSIHTHHSFDTACNLTITGLHTYYVLAGDTPVLVHNFAPAPDPYGLPRKPGVYIIYLDDGTMYSGKGNSLAGRWKEHFQKGGRLRQAGYDKSRVVNVEYRLPGAGQTLSDLESEVWHEFGGYKSFVHAKNSPVGYRAWLQKNGFC